MSERGSFTTQYIYNDSDYKAIRNALDRKSKFLCVSPPATWNNGYEDLEETVVSGKVGESAMNCEWLTIVDAIYGVKTKEEVRIVVMCDGGSIILITKDPDGETHSQVLYPEGDENETDQG